MNEKPMQTTAPTPQLSAFHPLVDKVGVPLLWFGLGIIVGGIFLGGKRKVLGA